MIRVAGALFDRGYRIGLHFVGTWPELVPQLDCSRIGAYDVSDRNGRVVTPSRSSASLVLPDASTTAAPQAPVAPTRQHHAPVALRRALGDCYYKTRRALARATSPIRTLLTFEVIRLRRDLVDARRLFDREAPDALVLPLESVGDRSTTLARVAHDRGIPIVIVPYTVPVNLAEVGERFYYDRRYWARHPCNILAAWLAPAWVKNYRGRPLLRLRPSEIAARWLLGLTHADPWKAGGLQFADAIAVENVAMRSFYLQEGYPVAKLQVTGTIADDTLAAALQNKAALRHELDHELGLDPGKPILLCAMPPDFAGREGCEFASYREIMEFWMATLSGLRRFNIVVRLHPSLDMKDFAHLAGGTIHFARRDTAQLIPLCDLFVASVSSTIRWAIACGIPVVNYDLYRFRYGDFYRIPGVLLVETPDAFMRILQQLDAEPDYFESVRAAQKGASRDWGALDGHAGDRIGALIERLAVQARTEGRGQGPTRVSYVE